LNDFSCTASEHSWFSLLLLQSLASLEYRPLAFGMIEVPDFNWDMRVIQFHRCIAAVISFRDLAAVLAEP
jgi:hypothetical protein